MEHLEEFFAVTLTSIYHVTVEEGLPTLEKIALNPRKKSEVAVGEKYTAPMLSIGRQLILFIPEGGGNSFERRIAMVNNKYWCQVTFLIAGLFFTKKEAEKCSKSRKLQFLDIRFIQNTKEVLDKIGEEHPYFSICHHHHLGLI